MTAADSIVDVAVVGAGIIGCLVAWELLRRRPELSVAVLDQDSAGSGASRRSAGVHFPRGATSRIRAMTGLSQRFYDDLRAREPTLPIYPIGMSVVSAELAEADLRRIYLDEANLRRYGESAGAVMWAGAGGHHADVPALVARLARQLRQRARVHEGVRVSAVEPAGAAVLVHTGTGAALRAAAVVLAPGPWLSAPAWHSLTAPLGARVKKVVALHVDRPPEAGDRLTVFQDDDSFLLPVAHRGHWLFSYTCQEWDVDPNSSRSGLSESDLVAGLDCLHRHVPALAGRVTGGRVFCDAYSPNREPVVTTLAGADGGGQVVFAGAANGSGYRLAPAIAAETADLLRITPNRRVHP